MLSIAPHPDKPLRLTVSSPYIGNNMIFTAVMPYICNNLIFSALMPYFRNNLIFIALRRRCKQLNNRCNGCNALMLCQGVGFSHTFPGVRGSEPTL